MQPNNLTSSASSNGQPDYSFITDPQQSKPARKLPGSGSLLGKVVLIAVAIILLLIIFSVVKGLVGGHSNVDDFVGVAQDQQEIIHLATNALEEPSLSTVNKDSALTSQLSLKSDQAATIKYLSSIHKKVKSKALDQKVNPSIDTQLSAAATASTYNQTYHDIMLAELNAYKGHLQAAYLRSKGPNGRTLLSKNFNDANLLIKQLDQK
jgi:competence protein ComGC